MKQLRDYYVGFRFRRIFETQKDRRIRLAQKFLVKALRGRCENFYGCCWNDRMSLSRFRTKGCLAIIAACYKTKTRETNMNILGRYFGGICWGKVCLEYFLQMRLDIENIKRRFKAHLKCRVQKFEIIAKDWDREIFTADTWESVRNKKRNQKKLGKDPIEVYPNILMLDAQTKKTISTYMYQKFIFNHINDKFYAGNMWKIRVQKINKQKEKGKCNLYINTKLIDKTRQQIEEPPQEQPEQNDNGLLVLTEVQVETKPDEDFVSDDSFDYPDPNQTIRYNKQEIWDSVYDKKFEDLINKAESIQHDFFYEKNELTSPTKKGASPFKQQTQRQMTKLPIKSPLSGTKSNPFQSKSFIVKWL